MLEIPQLHYSLSFSLYLAKAILLNPRFQVMKDISLGKGAELVHAPHKVAPGGPQPQ